MKNSLPFYFTWSEQATDVEASTRFPVERGEHDEFVLADGRRVYDMLSTSFQANFGHSHPTILSAIVEQLQQMPIASPRATFELKRSVSAQLLNYLALPNGKLFYTVSGSEAVENALKMARQVTGRRIVMARQSSYHGASFGALSVTGDWRNEPHLTLDEYTVRIPEPHLDPTLEQTTELVEQAGPDNIAAVIVETISGANGVVIPDQNWFTGLQHLCHQHGILLIVDEVLCGFGRTGGAFAFQSYDLQPDIVCLSKGITGGYIPFGAVWTGARIRDFYDDHVLTCGLTNYAHPLGLAATRAVMDLLSDERFLANKTELETLLSQFCVRLADADRVADVRNRGLLAAIDLTQSAPSWDTFFASGLHLLSKGHRVIIAPPYVSTPARLKSALDVLESTLFEQEVVA